MIFYLFQNVFFHLKSGAAVNDIILIPEQKNANRLSSTDATETKTTSRH